MDLSDSLKQLDARLARLRQSSWPPATVESLRTAFRTRFTYASNAIEGNTLTLSETPAVLEGYTVGGKALHDHLEALDHAEAWDAMTAITDDQPWLSSWTLRSLHGLVLRHTRPNDARQFRAVPVLIAGSATVPPGPEAIPGKVDDLFRAWRADPVHPVIVAARYHARLMASHPFVDGNGRTGRLMMNLFLLKHHYPPALIEPDQRGVYLDALSTADGGDEVPLIGVVKSALERTVAIHEQLLPSRSRETDHP